MTDRIANLWGKRTPFGGGEEWPVRVDQFLEEGVSENEVDRWVQTASILHSNGDALDIAVKDGRIVGVRGRAEDRVNKGRVDPKDLFGWQANNSEDRITRPLVRKNGELVETSWDEAFDLMVERSKEILEEKGPLAFGFYTTGQLFLEEYYTQGVIGKAGLGTPHMDGNTRLCTATAAAALKETFGTDGQPGSYADIDHADTICLYGHNVAETQAVLWMRMLDRLEGPNPPKLIVVDPRPTPPAQRADVHLKVKNGTNLALMNALLYELINNGWYDEEYVNANTIGFEGLKSTVTDCTPEWAAAICGVPAEQIREAARLIGNAERLLSTALQGFYQSHQATASACQINHIHLIRGMIGKPGCGLLQMNGQPTAQNTRECGANGDLPAHRPEHARVRGQRGPSSLPQLGQHRARPRARRLVERRADEAPTLGAPYPRHADLPLRRAGLHKLPLGELHKPGGLPTRAAAHPPDLPERGPLPRRAGHLPHRDRKVRRRRLTGGHLGREDRHVHQHRPYGAHLGE